MQGGFNNRPVLNLSEGVVLMKAIREIKKEEYPFLEEMLYQAIFVPQGEEPPPRDIIKRPELARYIEDFGKKGDVCFVAQDGGMLCGAAWARFYRKDKSSFDYAGSKTPELAIALLREYRGQGTGTALLHTLLERLKEDGVNNVMLSAKRKNRAVDLYRKLGFTIIREDKDTYIMEKAL